MNEFKTVVEEFRSDIKRVVEVMNHRFDQSDTRMDRMDASMSRMEGRMDRIEGRMTSMEIKSLSMMEQIALLHEGQTEIKAELRSGLKNRVTYDDYNKLEKRVTRLENKVA